jgi:hypothetical protein
MMNPETNCEDIEASQSPSDPEEPAETERGERGISASTSTRFNKFSAFVSICLVVAIIGVSLVIVSSRGERTPRLQSAGVNAQDSIALPLSPKIMREVPEGFTFCLTQMECNQQRKKLGIEKFITGANLPSKGCFMKRNVAYFGTRGSAAEKRQLDLPGRQQRIFCKDTTSSTGTVTTGSTGMSTLSSNDASFFGLLSDGESFGAESFGTLSLGDRVVTYLAPFKTNGPNIELKDGTFFEMINLPDDYDDSDWITGVTTIAIPSEAEFNIDGTVDMKQKLPLFVADVDERSASRFEGKKTVLAIRVEAANNKTTSVDEVSLSDSIFGNGVDTTNLASQYNDCSHGKFSFKAVPDRSGESRSSGKVDIVNGVATVRIPSVTVSQGTAVMRNAISKELNAIFGTKNPSELADYVMYCLPPGTFASGTYSPIGYAYYNNWLSVFNNEWCTSVSLQMHELGHSLNFGHSNEGGKAYEDGSGIMGASFKDSDRPKMCFNAAKSWQTGWYKDKEVSINDVEEVTCFNGTLHGIADYFDATTVLLKVTTTGNTVMFVNFNSKRGPNVGTQEGANQVLVVGRRKGERDSFAESELKAKLSSGNSYEFDDYTISVEAIDVAKGSAEVLVLPKGKEKCRRTLSRSGSW